MQAGKLAQKLAARGIRSGRVSMSSLLQRMVLSAIRNVIIIIGLLVALSQVGISLGPLLAGLGIMGFIIGFALQDSLSNFASGMMILMYRPFDVGDFVEVAGVKGKVDNMSLVNTTFLTFDNQKLVVPNNMVWQSVIANYTDQSTRRVDLTFGISYSDDIDKAETVIREVLAGYETILEEPEPVIKVGALGESSVDLIVRPWVRTEDYWNTYWDLTKLIKQAFDREGITIPFPQRDVHMKPLGKNA
jgi:small conductance mechanosensitive channel